MYIYVASSWRNEFQDIVCTVLQSAGHEVYDFKNPAPGNTGFHWSQVNPGYVSGSEQMDIEGYLKSLEHPIAEEGFKFDFDSLQKADACVLVLPCGRSAHLELGYAVGAGKKTAILNPDDDAPVVPELMYKMVDKLFFGSHGFHPLLQWLGE